ncbi:MAG: VOC family virulence protein [Rhodobacterales bacterium]|nr:MAG: VOC family virulence protein [Rhodobacterales bacterium]
MTATTPAIESLDHLVLTVADFPRTVAFYIRVLGMEIEEFHPADGSMRVALKFGWQKINLHLHGAEFDPKADCPMPGSADLCFLSAMLLADWALHLAELGVDVEEGPILSLYIRDPDGNLIEVSNRN